MAPGSPAAGHCRAGAARSTVRPAHIRTPVRPDPICDARRMRWLSPPDKRAGLARQSQIIQAHINQKLQPLPDFLENANCNFILFLIEIFRQFLEPQIGLLDGEFSNLTDVHFIQFYGHGFGFQAKPVTNRTGHARHEFLNFFPHP